VRNKVVTKCGWRVDNKRSAHKGIQNARHRL
jgi:hypothetical protein